MIAGERFEEIRVPHKGGIQDQIIEASTPSPRIFRASSTPSRRRRKPGCRRDGQTILAEASLVVRYGE